MSTAKQKRERRRAARPDHVVVNHITWTLVSKPRASEPFIVGGKERKRRVDVDVYCYRMVCSCGRERYAKPNSLHEVELCRVCQRAHRLHKRLLKRLTKGSRP